MEHDFDSYRDEASTLVANALVWDAHGCLPLSPGADISGLGRFKGELAAFRRNLNVKTRCRKVTISLGQLPVGADPLEQIVDDHLAPRIGHLSLE